MPSRPPSSPRPPRPKLAAPLANPLRPKSVLRVGAKGKIISAPVVKHPAPIERIASIYRGTQAKFAGITRKLQGMRRRGS